MNANQLGPRDQPGRNSASNNDYELVAGHQRVEALKLAAGDDLICERRRPMANESGLRDAPPILNVGFRRHSRRIGIARTALAAIRKSLGE